MLRLITWFLTVAPLGRVGPLGREWRKGASALEPATHALTRRVRSLDRAPRDLTHEWWSTLYLFLYKLLIIDR